MEILSNKYKFAKKLASEEEYKELADGLLEFAQKESSIDIDSFPLSLTIDPEDFAGFQNDNEYFKSAYKTSLRMIGSRLKTLMYKGAIDRTVALEMLPMYDPEYCKSLMYLKQKDDTPIGKEKVVVVYMPAVPETPLVRAKLEQIKAKHAALKNEG